MRHGCTVVAGFAALMISAPSMMYGQSISTIANLSVIDYQVVSEQRQSRTEWSVTYKALLLNTGEARPGVTATVKSTAPGIQVLAGQGTVHFSPVPANSRSLSLDTFTITVDRSSGLSDTAGLLWSFLSPVANAGSNQTATVGSTVALDGSASSNPSGAGSLTYLWAFVSRPFGSKAVLSNANSVIWATFVVDVPGNYVLSLTVSNGVGKDSKNVTVSTVNSAPVAKAGPNRTAKVGATVPLDGTASFDVDGDPISYFWSMVSQPPGKGAFITNFRSAQASFTVERPGTYVVQLIVSDGKRDSTPATVSITTENTPPVANGGNNQIVSAGSLVQLNGAGSTDVDGDSLIYKWSLINRPASSAAQLSDLTAVNPSFTADRPGTYVAQLIVNDGKIDSAPYTVTITTNAAQSPLANAGPNQTVLHGATVTLSGSGTDPGNLPLTLTWSLISKPPGSVAALSSDTGAHPVFVADKPGTYIAQLVVGNGTLNSFPATVTITTTNTPPVADAGPNQNVPIGFNVSLNGGGSSDADNDPLSFTWSFMTRPAGSVASLSAANSKNPTFVPDLAGTYVAQLIVNDGFTTSTPSTVTIEVNLRRISLTPNPLKLTGASETLTISLSSPSAAELNVVLAGFDPQVVSMPSAVTIPANSLGANVTVARVGPGTTNVLASAGGFQPGTATVTVADLAISIVPAAPGVGVTRNIGATVQLSAPVPLGSSVTVALSASPDDLVTLSPSEVTIGPGQSSAPFTITGVSAGIPTITGAALGYKSGSESVLVAMLGAIGLGQNTIALAVEGTALLEVRLSTPAPKDGVIIDLLSSDPSKATVPPSVFIPQGATSPVEPPVVTGVSVGSTTITASAGGYRGDTQNVMVVPKPAK